MSVKAVVIGCGGVANYAHLPNLRKLGVDVVGVCDIIEERAIEASKKYGGKALTDYREAVELDADFAVVATPPDTHYEITVAALEAGKDVFLEKPLAADLATAKRLQAAVDSSGRKVVPGLCLRFNPMFQYAASRLRDLGRVQYAYSLALGNAAGLLGPAGWVSKRERSGGMMTENVIHMIDALRWFAGDFSSVSAVYRTFTEGSTIEDNVSASIRFSSGAVGMITKSWTSARSFETWGVVAERGSIVVEGYVDGTLHVNVKGSGVTEDHVFKGGGEEMYLDEMREFVRYVKAGGGYPVSTLDALRAQELSEAARLSSEEKREVSVDEVRG